MLNPAQRTTYSNIKTTKIKSNKVISPEMIIKKELLRVKRDGTEVFKKTLNVKYWQKITKKEGSINVILDEAHTLINSRRAMSDTAKVLTDFLALLRRVLGADSRGEGKLILISQLERRLDPIAKEMANLVKYHVCHYTKICPTCGLKFIENNEIPDPIYRCPKCGGYGLERKDFKVEVYEFKNMELYSSWFYGGMKTYFKRYIIADIEKVFSHYNTLQWDNLITD